jgi:hypothetical protein
VCLVKEQEAPPPLPIDFIEEGFDPYTPLYKAAHHSRVRLFSSISVATLSGYEMLFSPREATRPPAAGGFEGIVRVGILGVGFLVGMDWSRNVTA